MNPRVAVVSAQARTGGAVLPVLERGSGDPVRHQGDGPILEDFTVISEADSGIIGGELLVSGPCRLAHRIPRRGGPPGSVVVSPGRNRESTMLFRNPALVDPTGEESL